MDLVEVAPDYDHTGGTAMLAARIVLDMIGYVFVERKRRAEGREAAAE